MDSSGYIGLLLIIIALGACFFSPWSSWAKKRKLKRAKREEYEAAVAKALNGKRLNVVIRTKGDGKQTFIESMIINGLLEKGVCIHFLAESAAKVLWRDHKVLGVESGTDVLVGVYWEVASHACYIQSLDYRLFSSDNAEILDADLCQGYSEEELVENMVHCLAEFYMKKEAASVS